MKEQRTVQKMKKKKNKRKTDGNGEQLKILEKSDKTYSKSLNIKTDSKRLNKKTWIRGHLKLLAER